MAPGRSAILPPVARTRMPAPLIALAFGVGLGCRSAGDDPRPAPPAEVVTSPAGPSASPAAAPAREGLNSDGSRKHLPPGPPSEPPFTLVLRYTDFGPPS